jgi:glycosyltransferase involved in cell wall biosynthesis
LNKKILVGVPPKNHIVLAYDEVQGLTDLGYQCSTIVYGSNNQSISKLKRLYKVVVNAVKLVRALYSFSPSFLYINSRFEPLATSRDFISVLIIRLLYYKRLKISIKSHGSDLSILLNDSFLYKKVIMPFMLRQVDAWFFLSNEEKEIIGSRSRKLLQKVYVTSNIIDPARSVSSAAFREKYSFNNSKFKVLYVGRMVREKGIFDIIKSITLIGFKEQCVFIFVGDGPDFKELQSYTEELELSSCVRFLGFIPDAECDHFYANTDLLVYPTFDTEGFPMALFKSVAAGLPIVTTRIRAAKDHLTAPENVLWVEAKSAQSIAAAFSTLYHNKDLRSSMSQNNKLVGKKFSRSNVCAEMNNDYFVSANQ